MKKLGLLPPHAQNYNESTNAQREYNFALFLFRYRVLDIGLWIHDLDQRTPSNIVLRTSLPSNTGIVSPLNDSTGGPLHKLWFVFSRRDSRACTIGQNLSGPPETFVLNHQHLSLQWIRNAVLRV